MMRVHIFIVALVATTSIAIGMDGLAIAANWTNTTQAPFDSSASSGSGNALGSLASGSLTQGSLGSHSESVDSGSSGSYLPPWQWACLTLLVCCCCAAAAAGVASMQSQKRPSGSRSKKKKKASAAPAAPEPVAVAQPDAMALQSNSIGSLPSLGAVIPSTATLIPSLSSVPQYSQMALQTTPQLLTPASGGSLGSGQLNYAYAAAPAYAPAYATTSYAQAGPRFY